MRRSRVSGFFASSTQQMNSLRAKGVMSSQAARASPPSARPAAMSAGSAWTTPPGSSFAFVDPAVPRDYYPDPKARPS
jgi:hypothetical protein